MTRLLQKLNPKKLGVFSFLLFFLFTPLLVKLRVAGDVYVEPLLPFLALGVLLILGSLKRKRGFLRRAGAFLFPNNLSILYSFLILLLLISYFYGWALTGIPSSGDLLRVFKHLLYFLPFPLAIYAGRFLGTKDTRTVLMIFVAVGVAAAVASFIRVFDFLFSGGGIDFWTYRIYNRSVGFLGQYFDPTDFSFGLTGKSAGATFGLYSSVVLGVCFAFVSQIRKFKSWKFVLVLVSSSFLLGAILYTLSRGAVMAGLLVAFAWVFWFLGRRRFRLVILPVSFLLVSSFVFTSLNSQVLSKLTSTLRLIETPATLVDGGQPTDTEIVVDSSTRGRIEMWGKILRTFETYPPLAVFGVGYHTPNLNFFADVNITHSLFLDVWVRGGLLALAVLVAVWLSIFGFLLRFISSRETLVRALGFTLSGFVAGWFIDNLISGEQFFSDAPMIAFWGVLGLVEALRQQAIGKKSSDSAQDKTKVLIALTSSGPGGAPKVVYDLLEQVSNKGQVTGNRGFEFVVAAPAGGGFVSRFKGLGYRVYRVPLDKIGVKGFTQLLKIARREKIDLINSHGKGAGLYARKIGFILGIPVVHTIHGIHYSKTNPVSRNLYLLSEKILSLFTKFVVSVSPSQEKEGLKLGIFPKRKSRVVVNGIGTPKVISWDSGSGSFRQKLWLRPEDFVVAMAARFDPPGVRHKGHERFIKLIPDLVKAVPNLRVIFAGAGECEKDMKKLARELGVSDNTIFLGERNDVPKILQSVDAFVLPSYHEGLPLSVLEASAAGLPVVGSNVVGIKDAVRNGETGFLVDFDKATQVSEAFAKLAKSPALRRRMGGQGRSFAEKNFSMGKFVDSTLKVYRQALLE